jgi:hypothetical protein
VVVGERVGVGDERGDAMSGLLGDRSVRFHPLTGKPILHNADGSISTEETITIEYGGKFYNIPTIVNGVRVPPSSAELLWKAGDNKAVGEYSSLLEAVNAAKERSGRLGSGLLR